MTNPLLQLATGPYNLVDFGSLKNEHYLPAFEKAVAEHNQEIKAITSQSEVTFENTLVALEKSGQLLSQMMMVFYNKSSADTNEEIQKLEAEILPKFSAHMDSIQLNPELFKRLIQLEKDLEDSKLSLDEESAWLVEKYLQDFREAGAELSAASRARVAQINERIAGLQAEFDKRLLADSNDLAINLPDASRLQGLSETEIASARQAAEARGQSGYTIPLLNYSGHPLLEKLEDRQLRQELLESTLARGGRGNSNDTSELIQEMLSLRAEKAKLFGFSSFAEYTTHTQTAKNPERIHQMLRRIAPIARANAGKEAQERQEFMQRETQGEIKAWDWPRYTEQIRAEKYSVDTSVLKPYFELRKVLEDGVFFAANRLYGISFKERTDIVGYHPDNWIYEVSYEDGSPCGLYIFDPYARPSKVGGAWMNNLVDQSHLLGKLPVVVNNMNIPKPAPGSPALMTFDEVSTLFHEFGHTLHGILSNVTYPRFSGTNVERDFVEFPSQVNEMWMLWPEVLANYAVHYETKEKLDPTWIDKILATEAFNQGFETTHYLQAAILDLAFHESQTPPVDLVAFEKEAISNYGLDFEPVPTRYKTNYFAHIFAGGYAAGYYGYIWSEVLDAESVNWFKANGGLTRENGRKFAEALISRGGSRDSMTMVREFLGHEPSVEPLMKRRGLA
ncbi:MAG: M3 family metallopeptidase [Aquiluna sp.]